MLDNIQIIYKPVKHISLKVKPTLDVILTVPRWTSTSEINEILLKKQDWVLEKLEYFKKKQVLPKNFTNGEVFQYLGQNYQLEISLSEMEGIKLFGNLLQVFVKNSSDTTKRAQLIDNWYRDMAKEHFLPIIDKYSKIVNKNVNSISIKQMTTRWGSCNPSKAYINLNLELIKKHPSAIEYVIFHELVHLLHYNHDEKFYNYVATHMPDWKNRRRLLNS